jgi:vesicle coat complex subunit
MLIMTSLIRVGQSKFVTVPIDEDSNERILSCIQTLSELRERTEVNDIFLRDTRVAYGKMLSAQEVRPAPSLRGIESTGLTPRAEACSRKERGGEHQGEYRAG